MVSRKRSQVRWQYVALVAVIIAIAVYVLLLRPSGGGSNATPPVIAAQPDTQPRPQSKSVKPAPSPPAPLTALPPEPKPSAPVSPPRVTAIDEPPTLPNLPETRRIESRPSQTLQGKTSDPVGPSDPASPYAVPINNAMALIEQGNLIKARDALNSLLMTHEAALSLSETMTARDSLAAINDHVLFSRRVLAGDPLVTTHTVQSGDRLIPIARRHKIPYQLIEHVNKVKANRIRMGQRLKIIKGPFHAVVEKSDFRMDVYIEHATGQWLFVRSFDIGTGTDDSTPSGRWLLRPGAKLENPGWTNPRTGKTYHRDDPNNPIGDYWIGLIGADDNNRDLTGYGIHGTIDPETIGAEASMGCVRMHGADIKLLFNLLVERYSIVDIRP